MFLFEFSLWSSQFHSTVDEKIVRPQGGEGERGGVNGLGRSPNYLTPRQDHRTNMQFIQ